MHQLNNQQVVFIALSFINGFVFLFCWPSVASLGNKLIFHRKVGIQKVLSIAGVVLIHLAYIFSISIIGRIVVLFFSPDLENVNQTPFGVGILFGVVTRAITLANVSVRSDKNTSPKAIVPVDYETNVEVLTEITGNSGGVSVCIRDFPYVFKNGKRSFLNKDFGPVFHSELTGNNLTGWKALDAEMGKKEVTQTTILIGGLWPINIEIERTMKMKDAQFLSDLADAVVDAMERNNVHPA